MRIKFPEVSHGFDHDMFELVFVDRRTLFPVTQSIGYCKRHDGVIREPGTLCNKLKLFCLDIIELIRTSDNIADNCAKNHDSTSSFFCQFFVFLNYTMMCKKALPTLMNL